MIGGMAGAAVIAAGKPFESIAGQAPDQYQLKGNIRHSVSHWCYSDIPLDEFARACKEMGIESIELLKENDWALVAKHGLKCAVGYATDYGIPKGFNRVANHEKLIADNAYLIFWEAVTTKIFFPCQIYFAICLKKV